MGRIERTHQRTHLRCETPPGASAQPLSRWSAAGQPLISRMAAACGPQHKKTPPPSRARQEAES
ncbi:MAG: hypothetical protein ACKO2L_12860, partial [Planctomycetaceae bacterium]